ncbi:MAG: arsenite methyltransferase [Bacteroidota bacterium]
MKNPEELKIVVKETYGKIASQSRTQNASSCCGSGSGCGCGCSDEAVMAEEYGHLEGYVPEADLGLGCGIPTDGAGIKSGDTVLDLGSGAGNDVFVARRIVGEHGTVIGVDFTEAMIAKANANKQKLGYTNVDFRHGDIEQLPVNSSTVDVVISNCVLNLVPDKTKAFGEISRVLKPGGHFSISDIVVTAPLPEKLKSVAELYAGCVSGALVRDEYLHIIESIGLHNVRVVKEKPVQIPEEILAEYLTDVECATYRNSNVRIQSITVTAEKP